MYLSSRAALVRNFAVALLNGAITLIILLIAPMGLAGVISNTLMVTVASFLNATVCDRVIHFLQPSPSQPWQDTLNTSHSIRNSPSSPLDRQ